MTRKKSNVKALALAVTCAILAGGYSGLNPVYAGPSIVTGNVIYNSGSKGLQYEVTAPSSTNDITELTVGGVTIGDSGKISGTSITLSGASEFGDVTKFSGAATFVGQSTFNAEILANTISEATSGNGVTVGGVKFSNNNINTIGAITASSLKLDGTHPINDVASAIATNKTNISSLQTTVGDNNNGLVKDVADNKVAIAANTTAIDTKADKTDLNTANGKITALEEKTTNFNTDGTTLTGMDEVGATKVSATTLEVGGRVINGEKVDGYDAAVSKTTKIIQNADGSTTVNDVTFNAGAVSGVKSINDKIKISDDGTVTINENAAKNPVTINSKGIKVGNNSAVVSEDGFKTSGDLYVGTKTNPTEDATDARFYVKGADGSIKAADGKFTVDDKGNVVSQGSVTAKGDLSAANGNFTVDGTTGNTTVKGKLDVTSNITGADITAKGALKGQTLGIGGTGNDQFTVDADGAVKAAGGKVKIDNTGKATFGDTAGGITTIEGQKITTGSIVATDTTVASNISGVQMLDGKITASNMEITGAISLNDLTVNNQLTVGTFSVDKTGVVKNLTSINDVAVAKNGAGLKIGSATVGDTNPFSSTGFTVDATGNIDAKNITAGTYNGNTIGTDNKFNGVELKGGDVKATKVTADTITDGTAIMTGGNVTANTITATSASLAGVTFDASGVDFNGKDIKNVANVTATTAKLGNLSIAGHVIKNDVEAGGPIGLGTTVTVNNAGELDRITKIDGVAVGAVTGGNGLEFGGNAIIGATGKPFSSTGFEVDGAGNVTGKSFKVNGSNYLDSTGLTTEKAVIGGVNTLDNQGIDTSGKLHVGGLATFGDDTGIHTTINGGTITSTDGTDSTTIGPNKIKTKTLEADTIILNDHMQDGAGNKIEIGADGHLNVAGNNFKIDTIGQLTNEYTGTDAAGRTTKTTLKTSVDGINANYTNSVNHNNNLLNINQDGVALGVTDSSNNNLGMLSADAEKATMGYGTANSIVVNKDTIKSALGTDVTRVMTNSATEQSIVDKVGAASRSLTANQIVDAAGGMTITTNNTGTTFSNGTNTTLINGSAITSTKATGDTGVLDGSNLKLTKGANKTELTAGGATFTGKKGASTQHGDTTTIDGGIITTDTLKVQRIQLGEKIVDERTGETIGSGVTLASDGGFTAAGGNFKVTGGATGSRGSITNVVGDTTNGKTAFETNQKGANMSFEKGGIKSEVAVADDSATISAGASSIKVTNDGITNTGKTTFKGAVDTTVPTSETTINGNTITTGKLVTDKLVIKGNRSGDTSYVDGGESGSIAFGGNGSITSNIIAGTQEATFKTDETGTFTKAEDGANVTTNTVNAQGNTNEVTDGTNTSTATQTATSIGGVVTNGTVKMRQELTADGVKVTDELGDPANYTQITNKDVSITDQKNTGKRINLSDLGQLNNLDGELTARDEYKNNAKTKETAVGAINAEAAIRREEVARLDNRIDDVNNRVDKVGAMAAAIASLKSIGYDPQAPSEFSIGLGQYKGETGVAMGFFHYPNKNFMINVSLSTAGGETMGGIGATWRFGHKSPQKLLEEQREAQAKKELAAAEKYQAAAKLAKEAQERAEYAAKLARQAQVSADNAKAAADATQAKHFQ